MSAPSRLDTRWRSVASARRCQRESLAAAPRCVLGVHPDDADAGGLGLELAGVALGVVGDGFEGLGVAAGGEEAVQEVWAAGRPGRGLGGAAVGGVGRGVLAGVEPHDVAHDVEAADLGDGDALAGLRVGGVEPDELAAAVVAVSSSCLHGRDESARARGAVHPGAVRL